MKTNECPDKRPIPQIHNRCFGLELDQKEVLNLFDLVDQHPSTKIPPGEISFNFVNEEEICRLHDQFFQDPEPTDVITFPGDLEDQVSGDICISPEYAISMARDFGHTFSRELSLYLIHGCLHLSGFRDHEVAERAEMRKGEQTLMNAVESANLFPTFTYTKNSIIYA